jgi:hypothetical protein
MLLVVDKKHQVQLLDLDCETSSWHRWLGDKELLLARKAIQDFRNASEERTERVHDSLVCVHLGPELPTDRLVDVHYPSPTPIDHVPGTGDGRNVNIPRIQISGGDWLVGAEQFQYLSSRTHTASAYAHLPRGPGDPICFRRESFPGKRSGQSGLEATLTWPRLWCRGLRIRCVR